jgi:dipeptidyl aminopeptidase/acylaminoacyl peptidase
MRLTAPEPFSAGRAAGRPSLARRTRLLFAAGSCLVAAAVHAEQAPPSIEELVEVTDLSGLAASPDGRRIAFRTDRPSIARNSYDLDWHVLDLASGAERRIAGAGEPIVADPGLLVAEPPIWSPDGRWLFYRALRSGAVQIWRSAADGSASEAVTAEDGDILFMERSFDGRSILYRVGPPRGDIERAELAEYDSGILVDEHVELAQNLFRGAIINGRHATQRLTGQWFARGGLLWSRPLRERKLIMETLALSDARPEEFPTPASGNGASAPPDAVARSNRGDVATTLWNGAGNMLMVVRANLAGDTVTCTAPECRTERVAWLAWRPGRDEIVFASADAAQVQRLHLWDVASNRVRPVAASDGLLNGGRSAGAPCAIAAMRAVCVAAGPASPPRLEIVDLEAGLRRSLFDPNAILRARQWPVVERLEWRSAEGRLFTGTLFMPRRREGRLPLFINYYRCEGFLRGGVGDEWPLAPFAASGIASVCVNATRITGPQDGVEQYRAAQGGLEALVDLLATRGAIDRTKVGLGGLSFGSEVTMWNVMHSGFVAAASIASPQFEPSNYWFNGVRGRDHHQLLRQVWGLGAPEETPDRWRLLSPALNADRIGVPLLLQLSEQESRYAIELYARLSNSATPAELYVFPDEAHIKAQPRHRLAVYRRNLDWFRFWLQDRADEDPARTEQYQRWRGLAERFRVTSDPNAATAPARQGRTP